MDKRHNILVTTYWSYKDALIQTYTLPYLRQIAACLPSGSTIYLVTLEQPHLKLSAEEYKAAEQELIKFNIKLLDFNYTKFGLMTTIRMTLYISKLVMLMYSKRIKTIHSFCTAGGAIGYLVSLMSGSNLIIDSYEPHAEASVENGEWKPENKAYKILSFLEYKMTHRAQYFIACAKGMKQYAEKTYNKKIDNNQFFVKPACVDFNKFKIMEADTKLLVELELTDKIVCVYAGKFGGIYLETEIFDWFKVAYDYWGDKFRVLLLTNQSTESLHDMANQAGLNTKILVNRFVAHSEVSKYMSLGTFGITPVKSIPTKKYCTPIKDGEYWAMGLPVVITPNISDDSDIISNFKAGVVWDYRKKEDYLKSVIDLEQILINEDRKELQKRIHRLAVNFRSFDISKAIYQKIYHNE